MIEFRAWVKIGLFLSSYIPFYILMAVQNRTVDVPLPGFEFPAWALFILLALFSGGVLYRAMRFRKSREPKRTHISTVHRKNELLTGYLLTYLFPFVNMGLDKWENWVALIIFFAVLAVIQYRSSQLHVNPVLTAVGYDIYEIEEADTGNILLLIAHKSKSPRGGGDQLTVKLGPDTRLVI